MSEEVFEVQSFTDMIRSNDKERTMYSIQDRRKDRHLYMICNS